MVSKHSHSYEIVIRNLVIFEHQDSFARGTLKLQVALISDLSTGLQGPVTTEIVVSKSGHFTKTGTVSQPD
ncbi:unnamed protein product [Sphenostylis stenocarpa]|uniref:Uncharacterized protein n=1 Tax=Sphenostylis stenocarpa TaxID=92480 RepID=A0AA87B6Z4_9FABA|nr:unnamed protein product [Sphenostylis stenocarpa]